MEQIIDQPFVAAEPPYEGDIVADAIAALEDVEVLIRSRYEDGQCVISHGNRSGLRTVSLLAGGRLQCWISGNAQEALRTYK